MWSRSNDYSSRALRFSFAGADSGSEHVRRDKSWKTITRSFADSARCLKEIESAIPQRDAETDRDQADLLDSCFAVPGRETRSGQIWLGLQSIQGEWRIHRR